MSVKIETPEKAKNFDPEEAQGAFEDLVKVFQERRLTIAEIIIVLGNLSYTLGASIEGFKEEGPSAEELQRMYYSDPSVGTGLMMTGITICSWYSSLGKGDKQ